MDAAIPTGTSNVALPRGEAAIELLRRTVSEHPGSSDAWRLLGDHLTAIGDRAGADAAYAGHIKAATDDPRLLEAATALVDGRIAVAETLLRTHLQDAPTDVAAIRLLAEVAARLGRFGDAEKLLSRCLELAPSFHVARHNLALAFYRLDKPAAALAELDRLLQHDAANPGYRSLRAAVLGRLGEYQAAIDGYAAVLAEYPAQAKLWMSYGHALKTAGRQAESVAAYRKSVELQSGFGEAWWSLANLKTVNFSDADTATLRTELTRAPEQGEHRYHLHFTLGKALEDRGEYAESFVHYAAGNRLRRAQVQYDADETSDYVQRCKGVYTTELFDARRNGGHPAPDPIFIVGLPRSGSTLIEQILASHSQVEGTMELPDIIAMTRELGARQRRRQRSRYPEIVADLSPEALHTLGDQYLRRTRVQRKTDAPLFIDKMPSNFLHTGFIQLILPNARIIDARRQPMACCFSAYKQHFARGQHYTYDLAELGRYYRDYVALMLHFDRVLPGRVYRVQYETMVEDTEREVRRLLEYCGLAFEPACLRFHENARAVRTASSEQVRQPIFRDAVDQWSHYAAWLGPLHEALNSEPMCRTIAGRAVLAVGERQ